MKSKIFTVIALLVIAWFFLSTLNWRDENLVANYYAAAQVTTHLIGIVLILVTTVLIIGKCIFVGVIDDRLRPHIFVFAIGLELLSPLSIANNIAFVTVLTLLLVPILRWIPGMEHSQARGSNT